eukprot:4275600-Prymnesium_polylepis.1
MASEFLFVVFRPFAASLSVYLPRSPGFADAPRVQSPATAVGYPTVALLGVTLHFRIPKFVPLSGTRCSPFGPPTPQFSPGAFACS